MSTRDFFGDLINNLFIHLFFLLKNLVNFFHNLFRIKINNLISIATYNQNNKKIFFSPSQAVKLLNY